MRRNGFFAGVIATLLAVVIAFGAYRFVVNRSEYLNGVGRIPGGDFNALISLPDGVDLTFPELIGKMIGPQIKGNRVLMIGDSIFASTSTVCIGSGTTKSFLLQPANNKPNNNTYFVFFIYFNLQHKDSNIFDITKNILKKNPTICGIFF